MAEQAGDGFLLYLIDMAIIEANAKARASNENDAAPVSARDGRSGGVRLDSSLEDSDPCSYAGSSPGPTIP